MVGWRGEDRGAEGYYVIPSKLTTVPGPQTSTEIDLSAGGAWRTILAWDLVLLFATFLTRPVSTCVGNAWIRQR